MFEQLLPRLLVLNPRYMSKYTKGAFSKCKGLGVTTDLLTKIFFLVAQLDFFLSNGGLLT